MVLRSRDDPQILPAIVEPIAVDVIGVSGVTLLQAEDKAMHIDPDLLAVNTHSPDRITKVRH